MKRPLPVTLEPGLYSFRTLSDASLKVVSGGVAIAATVAVKDPPPRPDSPEGLDLPAPTARGDEPPGEPPRLTIL